jgi:type IV pilus assembly protein PilE
MKKIIKKSISKNTQKRLKAFTLTEVMVVLVIIGILMLIALPNMAGLFSKANSLEAQKQLQYLASLEESFYQTKGRYSNDLAELGFTPPKTVQVDGGDAKYIYEIMRADQMGFLARATAIVDFDKDGVMNVWEVTDDESVKQTVAD